MNSGKWRLPLLSGVGVLLSILFFVLFRPVSGLRPGELVVRFGATFVFFGILPLAILRRSAGVTGLWRWRGLLPGLILVPLVTLIPVAAWVGCGIEEIRAEYPLWREVAGSGWSGLLFYELAYGLYYFGWEAFFRGFVLFGLLPLGGVWANLLQASLSTILHIGKPMPELIGAMPFGLLMGGIALRTRSFFYPLVFHYLLGVLTDLFSLLRAS